MREYYVCFFFVMSLGITGGLALPYIMDFIDRLCMPAAGKTAMLFLFCMAWLLFLSKLFRTVTEKTGN